MSHCSGPTSGVAFCGAGKWLCRGNFLDHAHPASIVTEGLNQLKIVELFSKAQNDFRSGAGKNVQVRIISKNNMFTISWMIEVIHEPSSLGLACPVGMAAGWPSMLSVMSTISESDTCRSDTLA